MDQFIILHALLTHQRSKRAELVSCQDSWEGGCQVTEKTQNLFGASNFSDHLAARLGNLSGRFWQVYINALQMPSDLEAVSSTGWSDGNHWSPLKGWSARMLRMLQVYAQALALNHSLWVLPSTLLCKRSAEALRNAMETVGKKAWNGMCFHIFWPFPDRPDPCHKHSPRHWLNNSSTSSCHTMIMYHLGMSENDWK